MLFVFTIKFHCKVLVKPQKSCSILGTLALKDETIKCTFLKLDQHFYLLLFVCWDLKQYSTLQEKVTAQLSDVNLAIHEFLPKTNTESTEVLYNFYIVQSEGTEEDTPKLTTVKRTKKKSYSLKHLQVNNTLNRSSTS